MQQYEKLADLKGETQHAYELWICHKYLTGNFLNVDVAHNIGNLLTEEIQLSYINKRGTIIS
jgi:hypothetical protein